MTDEPFDPFKHCPESEAVQPALEMDGYSILEDTERPNCDNCFFRTRPAGNVFCRICEGFACYVSIDDKKACEENEILWKEIEKGG
jgi:hypothetical protein